MQVVACIRDVLNEHLLPVILVSSDLQQQYLEEGLDAGCNDYVTMPPRPTELVARVKTQMRLRRVFKLSEEARLLHRMLPPNVIGRMARGEVIADDHRCMSVLFTDVVGFTEMSAATDTASVLTFLNTMFDAFDLLAEQFGVLKVDTIGDAYYAVCGHRPEQADSHATDMLAFVEAILGACAKIVMPGAEGKRLRIRAGLHCGPVRAGVVGLKTPRYTFLGDTVNTASRMESHGYPMCIHVRAPRASRRVSRSRER